MQAACAMDFKSVVYNAARDGKIQRLKIYLDHRSPDERQKLVHSKTQGATPLIMACRNGHLDVVEYLATTCKTDIEQVGSVTFDGETIEGAPPLWCAAAAGYLDIVKCLVKNGAKVNNTTYTNSTPLRAACFDGHFEVVKYLVENKADIEIANRHGHTCLMISCYKGHFKIVKYLLELKAVVDRKSVKGNTALHDCAESGSLDILKLLLSYKAKMAKDSYGMTPLLAASVTGHTNVVEYLISRTQCNREEKVDALELLGATYVDKKRDMLGALQYWRRAMDERYADKAKVIRKPTSESTIAAYEGAKEFQSHSELLDVISDPDNMRMQALLVRERILGPAHPDTSYYIRYRGAVYADMGNFERCITLWMYALEMQQKNLEPLNPMTQSSFLSFAELFSFMMTSHSRQRPAMPVSFLDMMVVLNKATDELKKGIESLAKSPPKTEKDMTHFNRLLVILMHLLALMCRSCVPSGSDDTAKARMTTDEELDFKKKIYQLVHLNPRGSKRSSLLHLACSADTSSVGRYPVCPFPCSEVAELLIEVGANVNACDIENNTPLHIAASNKPCKLEIIKLLLAKGAHLDACNSDHKTPMQLMRNATIYDVVSPLKYINLQCMAASAIIKHAIPYKGHVPKKLETFILMH